jgi:hypothetical protein
MPYAEVVSTAQPQPVRLTHRRPPVPLLGQAAGWGQMVQPAISRPSLTGCGPDSVISADPILFDTAGRLLIAVIDGRGSTHGQEHHQGERKLIRVGQLTFKAGNVMVADNRQGPERPKEAVVPFQRRSTVFPIYRDRHSGRQGEWASCVPGLGAASSLPPVPGGPCLAREDSDSGPDRWDLPYPRRRNEAALSPQVSRSACVVDT